MSNVSSKSPKPVAPVKPVRATAHSTSPAESAAFATVGWGPKAAILVTIVAFFLSQVLAIVLVGFVPAALGWSESRLNDWLNSVVGQFIFVVIAEALTLSILWWFLRRRKLSVRALGFSRKPLLKDLGYVLAGFAVYFVLLIIATMVAGNLFKVDVDQQQELGFDNVASSGERLMVFVSLVVLPPIVEEIIFRGFLYSGLRTKLTMRKATIITSVLFALPHLLAAKSGGLLWIAAVDTFVLSLVLCYLREKTGSLWASIGVHALKNGLAFLFLFIIDPSVFLDKP